jgi:tetratricopeptide (TPR) repeat protein
VRRGLVTPNRGAHGEYSFSFQDIIVLRSAKQLLDEKVHPRQIHNALRKLKGQLPQERSLSAVRISAEGKHVVVRDEGTVWNPESGQVQLDFSDSGDVAEVAPFGKRVGRAPGENDTEPGAEEWFAIAFDLESVSPEEAKRGYLKAIELKPDYADARVNLGRLLHAKGDYEEAEANYRKALEDQPENATAAFNLGVVLEDLKRSDDAVTAYEAALKADPSYADAHYNLAALYEKKGERASALRYLAMYRKLIDKQ